MINSGEMSAETLLALAERVEQASGPDRELDCAIYDALFVKAGNWDTGYVARVYTASLDAAMTLVPEGHALNVGRCDDGVTCWAATAPSDGHMMVEDEEEGYAEGNAATPALALVAAALRARAGK